MRSDNLLIVADSESDANMLFAVRMFVPDPFIYLRLKNRSFVVASDLEIDRVRKNARHCRVLALSSYVQKLKKRGVKSPAHADVAAFILRERKVGRVIVPGDFPYGLARELRHLKIKVKVRKGAFFPEREIKTAEEIKKISAALVKLATQLAVLDIKLEEHMAWRQSRLLDLGRVPSSDNQAPALRI